MQLEWKKADEAVRVGLISQNESIGYIGGRLDNQNFQLMDITIYPPFRRRGFGQLAIDNILKRPEIGRVEVILPSTEKASLRFFRAIGFEFKPAEEESDGGKALIGVYRRVAEKKTDLTKYLTHCGKLALWPSASDKRRLALKFLSEQFRPGVDYTESEVNEIINCHHTLSDWALLRRELFQAGHLQRTSDGRHYWVPVPAPDP